MRICVFEDAGCSEPGAADPDAAGLRPSLRRRRRCWNGRCAASPPRKSAALVRPMLADLCRFTHPEMQGQRRGLAAARPGSLRQRPLADRSPSSALPGGPAVGVVGRPRRLRRAARRRNGRCCRRKASPGGWRSGSGRCRTGRPAASLIAYPWDLVERNGEALRQDFLDWDSQARTSPGPRRRHRSSARRSRCASTRPPASSRWWCSTPRKGRC